MTRTLTHPPLFDAGDSRGRYLQEDVLGRLYPDHELLQFDQAQLKFCHVQRGGLLRILVVAQNVRDVAGPLKLHLAPAAGRRLLAARIPSLLFELPPAAVVVARVDVPLHQVSKPMLLRLAVKGSACWRGGHRVRPARRTPIRRWMRMPTLPPIDELSPHLPRRGARFTQALLEAFAPDALLDSLDHRPAWTLCTLWTPSEPVPLETITNTLQHLQRGSTSRFIG